MEVGYVARSRTVRSLCVLTFVCNVIWNVIMWNVK